MTRKFTFALQPVLDHRHRIEEERQQELALAHHALNEATAVLLQLHGEFRTHSNALREGHQGFDLEDLRLHYAHLEFLDRAITAQEGVVSQRKVELEETRLRLLEASKDKKAMEKLKTRRRDAHVAAENLIEQRELDDNNARRYSRSTSGGTP